MTKNIQSIRGMSDMLPDLAGYWQHLEQACQRAARQYGYQEIRFPVLEMTGLFKRAVGEVTDIVEKEMYTFNDRNGDSLSLRPEGTASCVRAALQGGLLYNQIQRLWYLGPMFRHERPQKGRYRQFHQFGIEAFGLLNPAIEVEQLLLTRTIFQSLNLLGDVSLELNTLGSFDCRAKYRALLIDYFSQYQSILDEDSKRRLNTNPLRILDSKNPQMQDLISQAPQLLDHLDDVSKRHFDSLCLLLNALNVEFTINPTMVRGLDYYCHTVYEWVTSALGAQGTVCAGGRYDGLVEKLGGRATPAVGFAMGLERVLLLLQQHQTFPSTVDAYIVSLGEKALAAGLDLAERCRSLIPNFNVVVDVTAGSAKSQFKKADKSGAQYALVLAEEEIQQQCVTLKYLREDLPQQQMSYDQLIAFFSKE